MRKMTLREWLFEMEFDYEKDDNGDYHLIDLQGANLGDIESEVFASKTAVVDRMDTYVNDYFLEALDEDFNGYGYLDGFEESTWHNFETVYEFIKNKNVGNIEYYKTMLYYCLHPEELEDDLE